jgi:1,2-dihydroxy-3-keto-5-methylthiopentene dioxygenase
MARLVPLWTHAPSADAATIGAFLAERGIAFEAWEVPAEARALAAKARLDDADKARLLALFGAELALKASADGYRSADVVALRADLPGVDEALGKFDRVHFHDDDEVRAIVGGAGVFGFVGDDGRQFLVEVSAGEYLSVPAGMWHWFYCHADKDVTAIRLFRDVPAWTPHYRSTARGAGGSG